MTNQQNQTPEQNNSEPEAQPAPSSNPTIPETLPQFPEPQVILDGVDTVAVDKTIIKG
jgi:hypothetical protein